MATVETGGAGGKFRKKPIRRSQATPYDRPPTALRPTLLDSGQRANNNGWLSKLVDPASRLITAGAHKFFSSVFRKRILPPPDETRESGDMQRDISPMVAHSGSKEPIGRDNDPTKVSTSGEVAELEDIFKQKTFTRSEIDHLTTLLLSRAVDSSVEVDKGRSNPIFSDEEAVHNSSEIVASFPTLEKGAERVAISTPAVISKVVEDVASPAELAKAYMGSRSSRASPSISVLQNEILREDLSTPNNSFLQRKSQANSLIQKHTSDIGASSNGFMTPQLRGRSAIYNMASTPYSRPRPTQVLKAAKTDLKVHGASSSYNITETQQLSGSKRQVLKRRSSVLESDIGFVGPIRRIRQKPSLLHHKTLSLPPAGAAHVKHVSERLTDVDKLPYNHFSSKALPDTGVRSKSNGYVPSQSIKTAEKIFEHLDKITSKGISPEKKIDVVGGSSPVQKASDICDVSPHKSSSTVDSLNVLKTNDSRKESGLFESNVNALDRSPNISQRVNKGSLKRFSFVEDAAEAVSLKKSMENVNPESSSDDQQKKQKFQMSAHEDYLKLDKVNAVDGACTPINKVVESHALAQRSVGISFNAPESAKSSAGRPPAPETNPSSNLCTNIEVSLPDGSAATQKSTAFSFPVASSSSSATNHSTQEAVSSPLLAVAGDKTAIQSGKINDITASSSNGANFAPHLFSPSSIVQSASVKDMKTDLPSSASGAVAKTDERDRTDKSISFDVSKKMDTPSFAVGFAKGSISSGVLSNGALVSNGLPSVAPMPMGASSPIQVSSTSNDQSPVPVSSPAPFSFSNGNALFSSIAASTVGTPITSNLSTFGSSTNHLSSSATAAPALFESSFQSGFTAVSSISSTVVTSGLFTAKPSVTASVGNAGSVFNASTFKPASSTTQNSGPDSNGLTFTPQAPASTVAVTTSASASSPLFGSSGSVGFNASVSTFSNPFTSSSTSGSSVSSSSTVTISSSNMFGWQSPNPTAPFGTSQSTGFTFGLKAPGTSSATNSTLIVFGATPTSSTASKTAPFVFGSSSPAASIFSSPSPAIPTSTAPTTPFPSQPTFGSSTPQPFSFSSTPVGNNDQMSMDHSMAEDSVQVSTPTAPVFGAPISAPSSGFVFGGAAPAPSTASPFQFGGQQNQFGPQNTPFQPSGSIELNNGGAGSFSLGSGGVDSKANRRIIKVKNRIRKK